MADDGIQATMTGTVSRVFSIGFEVEVPSGKYPQRVSVFVTDKPAPNQTVTVSGILTMSKDKPWQDKEGNTRESWSLKVNGAQWQDAGQAAAQHAPAADPWNAPSDDGMPF
jgi:hypothetical protein